MEVREWLDQIYDVFGWSVEGDTLRLELLLNDPSQWHEGALIVLRVVVEGAALPDGFEAEMQWLEEDGVWSLSESAEAIELVGITSLRIPGRLVRMERLPLEVRHVLPALERRSAESDGHREGGWRLSQRLSAVAAFSQNGVVRAERILAETDPSQVEVRARATGRLRALRELQNLLDDPIAEP